MEGEKKRACRISFLKPSAHPRKKDSTISTLVALRASSRPWTVVTPPEAAQFSPRLPFHRWPLLTALLI
ncbi:hypothetical protein PHAVU_008G144600 [Phaseolus vulgaris]|uniref:Uncharacterized protein n=1 Tax=Phaseolus vulgaris TaxID=3885 RepID=V7B4S7_PHAVU|nr:hypothetical protein PHAVU_008G144600g [Phaseolus vulgaris]ESW12809.1 hypothetical protein PHAVU_008G144600g [Phaseolus vulgaris]